MNLTLKRNGYFSHGIFGELLDDKSQRIAFTLEHAYSDEGLPMETSGKDYGPKLPPGTYKCVRGEHQLHSGSIETFEVTGVPGHSGILIHCGNTEDASEGCILVGLVRNFTSDGGGVPIGVGSSRDAFKKFLDIESAQSQFTLTVEA